jgi:poly-beta-1,6-N-acetyl-D-glucosamine synthase
MGDVEIMEIVELVFWLSLAAVGYVYVGYPLLLLGWSRLAARPVRKASYEPRVSLVIAAYNERFNLAAKVDDCLALDYPAEKLEIVLSLDGSTDGTSLVAEECQRRHPEVTVVPTSHHLGKAAALNRGMQAASGEVVVFCDVRQHVDAAAIRELVANFSDPAVGAVTGELMLLDDSHRLAGDGVGLYWRYEKRLRAMESAVHSTVGATGALYAVRRSLLAPLPERAILDDMIVPLRAVLAGHRTVFEPRAQAYDRVCPPELEFPRKLRTLVGNFQLLRVMPQLLDPRRNPVFLQFVSHKVGRLLVPYCLVSLLAANLFLHRPFYVAFLIGQCGWYSLAAAGALVSHRRRQLGRAGARPLEEGGVSR